jgi:hypothetical protein
VAQTRPLGCLPHGLRESLFTRCCHLRLSVQTATQSPERQEYTNKRFATDLKIVWRRLSRTLQTIEITEWCGSGSKSFPLTLHGDPLHPRAQAAILPRPISLGASSSRMLRAALTSRSSRRSNAEHRKTRAPPSVLFTSPHREHVFDVYSSSQMIRRPPTRRILYWSTF